MFKSFSRWGEGQYFLGYCHSYVAADDLLYWRTWWKDTPIDTSQPGRELLRRADQIYYRGLREGVHEPPSRELCQRTVESWFADMKKDAGAGGKAE